MSTELDELRELLPKGTTVFTILRHVSPSGMGRWISPVAIIDGEPFYLSHLVSQVTPYKRRGKHDDLYVGGAGMDMGFHLVYTLSRILHGDGYALEHRWL